MLSFGVVNIKADIFAYQSTNIIGRLIKFITGGSVVHVALAINEDYILESSYFGVKLSKITSRPYLQLRNYSLTEDQKNDIVNFAMIHIDTEYDYRLFFGIGLNKLLNIHIDWDDKSKYICVELIVEAYRSIGIELLNIKDSDIVPSDLTNSPYLTAVM